MKSKSEIKKSGSTITSYVIGFVLSVILTIVSYLFVTMQIFSGSEMVLPIILMIAVIQMVIQLVFFLHIGNESHPRWNLLFLLSTVSLVLLIVIATIWIMTHLNYNMSPRQINQYIKNQEGAF
jgi:cytochrome o ubiquinol oxidase subunit IV